MAWIHKWLAACALWMVAALPGFAQALPDWLAENGAARPPDYGVRDEGGFFNKNSGATKRISTKLQKLESDHGFRIFLMVEPVLIATTASELASQLQQSWLPDGGGLVVVYESDNRSLGFGREVGGGEGEDEFMGLVPAHATAAILRRAQEATDLKLAPEAYVEALMGNLVTEFDSYFVRRSAPLPAGRSMRLGLLTVGALTLLALAAIVVGSLAKLPSLAGTKTYHFPLVDRPERLGAPFGGGSVTTRRFSRAPKNGNI